MSYRVAVITCSDRAFADIYEDRSGAVLRKGLSEAGFDVADVVIVPDDRERILMAVIAAIDDGARIVMTTGGTGVGPRDVTVEAVSPLVDYELPGLMEEIRRKGTDNTPLAVLSRGIAGVISRPGYPRALILTAPGSRGGARDTLAVAAPLLTHIVEQLDGAGHV